ncbi:S-(hydroxymethyl)glutathione dehydrogenase/alcohol dehydrogenase [Microbacterium resistens]|uniref:S-(Hydroxymethyl)glutathione dehydrogenase/alcohol dehydrogenase n=1 Tax=Microbacterium resistens TaxID=156977 RepID=A0ABU1SCW2_9MICO|nr:zinc-binding dehydrogenase [Microbacterium resistens]MDR6867437.1 S-(hydroxymethyl)glutathione dehydrogenase/alcohol dehydrogenase [Microbacterium resistens]
MRAAVATGVGQGFTTKDVEIDVPIGREVLIDVKASGLCHSDLHIVENDFGFRLPSVLGHEIAGIVTAIGPDVSAIAVGDHVVGCLIQFCGACTSCLSGRTYECPNPTATLRGEGEGSRLRNADGSDLGQSFGLGGFAEQALVHENQLAVVRKDIPFAQAAIIGCAVATGAGAAINSAGVRVGDTVAVVGTGGVGLNAISGALIAGASRVIAIDIEDGKLEAAKSFGATDVINSRRVDPVAEVLRLTDGGVDHAFEVIGLAATQEQVVAMPRPGGHSYFIGMAKPGTTVTLDSSVPALTRHSSVEGVVMGSTNLKRDIPMYADLYMQGRLNLDGLVSQEISIDQIDEAYEALKRGEVIRSVITRF